MFSRGNGNPDLVGRAVLADRDMPGVAFPDTVIAGTLDESRCLPRLFVHLWKSDGVRQQLRAISRTTNGTYKINQQGLTKVRVSVPPLDEQRRIAAILDHADALSAQRRQVVAHLTGLTESIFRDMFGRHPWSSTLRELADIQIGPFGSLLHKEDYVTDGVPVINPMHIKGNRLEPDMQFSVSPEKAAALTRYRLRDGDIVLGRRGEMGRAGVATLEHAGMLCGTGSLILRPKQVEPSFLHALVTSQRMKRHLERHSLGATLPNLNAGIVRESPAPTTPLELQRDFASLVSQVRAQVADARRALAADDELFVSLQARAFRGEL